MAESSKESGVASPYIGPEMARAMASGWRSRILMEMSARSTMSPSQFVEEVGGDLAHISRCFRQLAQQNLIELVEERRGRRGGMLHVYRRIQRAHFDTPAWKRLPQALKEEFSNNILASYFARVAEALEANTFDEEGDRHLSWDLIHVDRRAWTEFVERLDELVAWTPELEAESAERMAESGEEPIPMTWGLAAFRSPSRAQRQTAD